MLCNGALNKICSCDRFISLAPTLGPEKTGLGTLDLPDRELPPSCMRIRQNCVEFFLEKKIEK